MAKQAKTTEEHALYLPTKHAWFWIVPCGQRSLYYGPYATQVLAEKFRTDVDAYAAHGWNKD